MDRVRIGVLGTGNIAPLNVAGYLEHQGELFWKRFDPNAYLCVTRAMELFDPQRDWRGRFAHLLSAST